MSKRHLLRTIAAIAVGAGLAFGIPALPAVGQVSPPTILSVELGDEATLVARGAAVIVPVEVVCPAGSQFTGVSVRVTQRAGSRIASGFGGTSVACTGEPQTVEVLLHAENMAFKKGPAVAEARLFVCNEFGCQEVSDTETIRIVR